MYKHTLKSPCNTFPVRYSVSLRAVPQGGTVFGGGDRPLSLLCSTLSLPWLGPHHLRGRPAGAMVIQNA